MTNWEKIFLNLIGNAALFGPLRHPKKIPKSCLSVCIDRRVKHANYGNHIKIVGYLKDRVSVPGGGGGRGQNTGKTQVINY